MPRGSWLALTLVFLLTSIEAAFSCVVPLGVRYFIESVVPGRSASAFWMLVNFSGGALAAVLAAGFVRDFVFARLRSRAMGGLRRAMFRRLQNLSMQVHAAMDRTRMLERFSLDLATVENAFSLTVSQGAVPFASAVLATGIMLWLDWRIGLIAVILWPWALLSPRAMAPKSSRAKHESLQHETGVLNVVEESLAAQAIVRAFGIEHLGSNAFRSRNDVLTRSAMKAGLWSSFVERFTGAGILLEQIFVLGLSLWLVFNREMSVGSMVAVQMLAALLGHSLLRLVDYLPELSAAQQAFAGVRTSLEDTDSVTDAADARTLPAFNSEIVFAAVGTAGAENEPGAQPNPLHHSPLTNVSLRIPKGSYAAFVGASGAGKSAMLKLLMRFADPASGRVTVDGHDLRQVTQASLRAQMGVVLQDGFVFNTTLRENIRMGRPAATEEAIVDAARDAGLLEFIQSRQQGFDSVVGTGGIWLSAEMKQRLALARALLRKPAILLLDEISSALDPAEELAINQTLDRIASTTTVISATHRLASVSGASHIFVFDEGKMVEQGSHFELMALDGAYANLWHKQAGFRFSPDGRHVDVDAQRLQALPILEKVPEAVLTELAPFFATETFESGREIVCQNDPGDKFYIIARGKVEVWRTEEHSGVSLCVGILNDGDYFGEITLITGFPRTATVRTVAVTTCISLERGQFTKLIDRLPDLKRELSRIAIQRLQESSKRAAAGGV